jgi:hypothetical protein
MGLTQNELNFLTAQLIAAIHKPVLELGGRIDHLRLEITGHDTETGEPIDIRINQEITDNWTTERDQ